MQYITTHIIAIQQVINSLGLGYHVNMGSGPWFNIKMSSYQYKKSLCGDKTILRLSYLHNEIFYTGKMTSLYWISLLVVAWCCQAASKLSLWWPHVALSLNELTHCGLQGSDQFMNWIGIDYQFNSIQHELNWNWIERFWIGIELELEAWTDRNWSIQSINF